MKTFCLFLLIAAGNAAQENPVSRDHTAWVAASLRTMQTIKPGMTRAEVLKVFKTEGGISNRLQRTYVFRDCPYVKVDVRFKPVGQEKDVLREDPADIIIMISRPYLDWSMMD
jgi:hypothetical protein